MTLFGNSSLTLFALSTAGLRNVDTKHGFSSRIPVGLTYCDMRGSFNTLISTYILWINRFNNAAFCFEFVLNLCCIHSPCLGERQEMLSHSVTLIWTRVINSKSPYRLVGPRGEQILTADESNISLSFHSVVNLCSVSIFPVCLEQYVCFTATCCRCGLNQGCYQKGIVFSLSQFGAARKGRWGTAEVCSRLCVHWKACKGRLRSGIELPVLEKRQDGGEQSMKACFQWVLNQQGKSSASFFSPHVPLQEPPFTVYRMLAEILGNWTC